MFIWWRNETLVYVIAVIVVNTLVVDIQTM